MIAKKHVALATLTVCALALSTLGSTKHPVERPFKNHANATWVLSLQDGSGEGQEWGEGTHVGRYTNQSSAIWDLDPAHFGIVSGQGTLTAANGDEVFWVMTPEKPGVVQTTGGTGRFENATGEITAVSLTVLSVDVDLDTLTMTMTLTYTGVGTITY